MIFPCRIRGCRNHVLVLRFALLFAACFLAPVGEAMAQYAAGSTSEAGAAGGGRFTSEAGAAGGGRHVPLGITAGVDLGYDDHVLGSNATTSASGQGSFSVRENLVLTYDRSSQGTDVHLTGVGSFTQFVNVGTNDKDVSLTLGFTHNFSTRLSFRADLFTAYQTEPNFQSNVGPENVRAPHFYTDAIFSVTYRWLPRVSTSTSYTFRPVKYEQTTPTTTTFRTGLNATYRLTSRLNARAAVYYYNSDNQGSSGTTSAGLQDGLQVTLGLNYTINKRWAVNADYAYSAQFSSGATGGYSRNHYFAGVTYRY